VALVRHRYETHLITDASRVEVIDKLWSLLRTEALPGRGSLIVLWAGHGLPTSEQKLHLIVRDTTAGSAPLLTPEHLAGIAARTGAAQILLILDTSPPSASASRP
jgi:hypothetical protein